MSISRARAGCRSGLWLLAAGVLVGQCPALIEAAGKGDTNSVTEWLGRGVDPSCADDSIVKGWTPLMAAAKGGFPAVVDALIRAHANVDATNGLDGTALDVATANHGRTSRVAAAISAAGGKGHAEDAAGGSAPDELPEAVRLRLADSDGRSAAALALGKSKDPRAVEPLIRALKDADPGVRQSAAIALGSLADARSADPLIAALGDPDEGVVGSAAGALGAIKDPRSTEPLIAALKSRKYYTRLRVIDALGAIKDPRAVETLVATLKNRDSSFRIHAVDALAAIKDPRSVEPLIAALEDPSTAGRAAAALGSIEDARAGLALARYNAATAAKARAIEAAGLTGREARIAATLPSNRKRNAVYRVLEDHGFTLVETIDCGEGDRVAVAEMMVPCGAIFVNSNGEIGGRYYFLPYF